MRTFRLLFNEAVNLFPPSWAAIVAGAFVLISISLSMYLLFEHLSGYNNPEEQKFLVGVILMVPCYSIESRALSWLSSSAYFTWHPYIIFHSFLSLSITILYGEWKFVSLMNPSISVFCEILRDCYEAFAMYCFGRYLIACLGGEKMTIDFLKRQGHLSSKTPLLQHGSDKGIVKHPFPMNYVFKPWRLGQWFYQVVKFGIVQYMIIKTFTALSALVLQAFGVYCEGEFKLHCGYPYMAVVLNFSQSWALYCLVQFYNAIKDELAHIKPLAKFLTFKSIVFLTWWQGVAIAILFALGLFKSPIAEALQFKSSIQDFIICIEMGAAAVVHLYVFPAKPYALMSEWISGNVAVLGDYASVDCPLDPDEVRDSERPTKLRMPQQENVDVKSATAIRESVRDVFVGGGGYIVKDVKFTVTQAVEPMEKGITRINQKLHKISENIKRHEKEKRKTKDDSCINSSSPMKVIRGIDDPLLNGSVSDGGFARRKHHRRRESGYNSAESGGESSDQSYSSFQIRGHRWISKD